MKKPRALTLSIATLLLNPLAALAVTDIWDGGGGVANQNLNHGPNWADGTAPASSLVNTDLVFAGSTGLLVNVSVPFSAHSIAFDNTAGDFNIVGLQLSVGTGGIANFSGSRQRFQNTVSFSGVANATVNAVNAASGRIEFTDPVALPTGTLTIAGAGTTFFEDITGSSTLSKTGAGRMVWSGTAATAFDVSVSDTGTLDLSVSPPGGTMIFTSASSVSVNGTNTLRLVADTTLDGAQLTRASGATLDLVRTLTVQNGGDALLTGAFTVDSSADLVVTGAGSTFSTTSTLTLGGGSRSAISAAGGMSSGTGALLIGTAGDGRVTVTGTGSTLTGGSLDVGGSGDLGTLTFSSGSTGPAEV